MRFWNQLSKASAELHESPTSPVEVSPKTITRVEQDMYQLGPLSMAGD